MTEAKRNPCVSGFYLLKLTGKHCSGQASCSVIFGTSLAWGPGHWTEARIGCCILGKSLFWSEPWFSFPAVGVNLPELSIS